MNTPSKTELICYVLKNIRVGTRVDILRRVYALKPGRYDGHPTIFKVRSNNCYFTQFGRGNGGHMSLVKRGIIQIAGKRARRYVYELTPLGQRYANDYDTWRVGV